MKRIFSLLVVSLTLASCGLAESEQDEKNRYIYLVFTDPAFERYCLGEFDLNGDGRISRYEAQRVLSMNCSNLGIRSLWDISEFSRLESLDCSRNDLTELDVRACTALVGLDCRYNDIQWLDVNGLRRLSALDCSFNALGRLDLQSNASLLQLDCSNNVLAGTLDVTACFASLRADVRSNPALATVYRLSTQSLLIDGQTGDVVVR